MKFLKQIEISLRIRPVFLRATSYLLIFVFLVAYFIASWTDNKKIINILSFDTSSAIFWIIIILILVGHLDYFREIIKDLARSKVSEFVGSSYFRESVSQLLNDDEFKNGINNIVNNPSKQKANNIALSQDELDTGSKIN